MFSGRTCRGCGDAVIGGQRPWYATAGSLTEVLGLGRAVFGTTSFVVVQGPLTDGVPGELRSHLWPGVSNPFLAEPVIVADVALEEILRRWAVQDDRLLDWLVTIRLLAPRMPPRLGRAKGGLRALSPVPNRHCVPERRASGRRATTGIKSSRTCGPSPLASFGSSG